MLTQSPRDYQIRLPSRSVCDALRQIVNALFCKIPGEKGPNQKAVTIVVLQPDVPGHQLNSIMQKDGVRVRPTKLKMVENGSL